MNESEQGAIFKKKREAKMNQSEVKKLLKRYLQLKSEENEGNETHL